MEHPDDCYEYLHGYPSDSNRCLQIAADKYKQAYGGMCYTCFFIMHSLISCCVHAFIGTYHQYDTAVYPKYNKTSKSFLEVAKETAKSVGAMFGFVSNSQPQAEEDITLLSSFEIGKLCLEVYLERYKQMLCSGEFPRHANLQTIVEEICHIFNLLYYPITYYQTWKLNGKFLEVCLFHKPLYANSSLKCFTTSGNEGMAGVCCRCSTK